MADSRVQAILAMMQAASEQVVDCARRGLFEKTSEPNLDLISQYEDYRAKARLLLRNFLPGEEDVAFWTQVELYAGFLDPAIKALEGAELFSSDGSPNFTPPRVEPLESWSRGAAQPVYASAERPLGDRSRHGIVSPNSSAPVDMEWAPILL